MSGTRNNAILIGRLGKNPEIRQFQDNRKFARFSLATDDSYTDKQGIKHSITDWHDIEIYNPNIVNIVEKYLQKGSRVYLEGSIKKQKYETNTADTRYKFFIKISALNHRLVLLDKKQEEQQIKPESIEENYLRMKEEGY
jgi:single-strand DNA-binding protein